MWSSLRAVTSSAVCFCWSTGRVSFGIAVSSALSISSHSSRPSTLLCRFWPIFVISSNLSVKTFLGVRPNRRELSTCYFDAASALAIAGLELLSKAALRHAE